MSSQKIDTTMNKNKQIIIVLLSAIILLVFDIVTKIWVTGSNYEPIVFIKNFFYLTNMQTNSGIAFGIQIPMIVQIVGSIVILIVLFKLANEFIFKNKKHTFIKLILFGIIIGGAIGNLIERIIKGYVVDFIVLKPIPVFNIADIGITVGLILLFLIILIEAKTN